MLEAGGSVSKDRERPGAGACLPCSREKSQVELEEKDGIRSSGDTWALMELRVIKAKPLF